MDFLSYRVAVHAAIAAVVLVSCLGDRAVAGVQAQQYASANWTYRSPSSVPPPAPRAQAAALDLDRLVDRLRNTSAIGMFGKLALKNRLDGLIDDFRRFHAGDAKGGLGALKGQFEGLLVRTASLVREGDPKLRGQLLASRDALWTLLSNPAKFKLAAGPVPAADPHIVTD